MSMGKPEKKLESPLYINRIASTFVANKEGKTVIIREGGEMIEPEKKILTPLETPKNLGSESGTNLQNIGGGAGGNGDIAGGIDKIRDLIFGNQMQDYEKRFSRLEERMFKEMNVSKNESKKNFDSLEKIVNKEIESLKNQITAEQNARTESFKELSRQLKDTTRSFEKKLEQIGEQFNDNSNDMRQQILELSQSLRNDIRQKYEETSAAIERVALELQTNKVDRSSLSNFFTEIAMRINNDRT